MQLSVLQDTTYVSILWLSVFLSALSALYIGRRRVPGAGVAVLMLIACTGWTFAYSMEMVSTGLSEKLMWAKMEYVGVALAGTALFLFAARYTGSVKELTLPFLAALSVVPTGSVLLVFTNEFHGLIWPTVQLDPNPFAPLLVTHGIGFWLFTIYQYLLVLGVGFLLLQAMVRSSHVYRWQATSLLVVAFFPFLGNALYLFSLGPFPTLDLTPVCFTLASLVLAWSLSSSWLSDVVSVSRRTAFDSMTDGVLVLDADERIVDINPAARRIIGLPVSRLKGHRLGQAWPEWVKWAQASGDEDSVQREITLNHGGTRSHYDIRISRLADWRGRLISQVIVLRDITELKETEEALRDGQARFRAIFERAAIGMTMSDWEGRFMAVNPAMHSMLGYSGNDLQGKCIADVTHPDDVQSQLELHRELLVGIRDHYQIEKRYIHKEGHVVWGRLTGSLVRRPSGEPLFGVGMIEDITEQKRAEDTLRASEARYRTVLETVDDALHVKDVQGRYITVNHEIVRRLGRSREEILGKTALDLYDDPEVAAKIMKDDMQVIRTGAVLDTVDEFPGRTTNRLSHVRKTPLRSEDGQVIGIVTVSRDITERRNMEEQLLRAQRLETAGRIAGQVAHDFNNLLAPLVAYPDLIKAQLPPDHPGNQFCDAMVEAAERMAEINEDLMALGRRGHFDSQPVDLNQLARQVVDEAPAVPETLELRLQLDPRLPSVTGSPAQLQRVISNLVSNSREAMGDSGAITLRTSAVTLSGIQEHPSKVPAGHYVRVSVVDDGPGIPPELREKIFDPFFTTKSKARRRGCGLGLTIVQGIVEDHEGYLRLEPYSGRGAAFHFYLPAVESQATALPTGELPMGSESVLIVDDDQLQREVSLHLLNTLGYLVDAVPSGEAAVELLSQKPVDLLILDMIMPEGMDGAETYRRVLDVRPGQKAIMVSGFAPSERVLQAQALGAGAYIRKPVSRERLAQAVREELDRK